MSNPYIPIIHRNLPRLLGQINQDPTDPYFGCADRQFWAWKLIDFSNATSQASVHGLALLRANNMLPDDLSSQACFELIIAMITVIPKLSDRHGGLAESFPNESSFCVTALVLSNVLGTLSLIEDELSKEQALKVRSICSSMAEFLKKQDEYHGLISNHLATAALALYRWFKKTGDLAAKNRCEMWVARIRKHANMHEGWMSEYGTADAGYQSWALTELVQLNQEGFNCEDLIHSGYNFISCFAMPDGSFGNAVGGRLTRFLFPGGVEMAKAPLTTFARDNIQHNKFVSLDSIDAPNFAPFFNDLCLAAIHMESNERKTLPYEEMNIGEAKFFEKAGIITFRGPNHYRVLSVARCNDYVGTDGHQIYTATNGKVTSFHDHKITLHGDIIHVKRKIPTAFSFLVLRSLSLTIFQFLILGNHVKKMLARYLVKSTPKPQGKLIRHIDLITGDCQDETIGIDLKPVRACEGFSPKHMASQGYWQKGDTT